MVKGKAGGAEGSVEDSQSIKNLNSPDKCN